MIARRKSDIGHPAFLVEPQIDHLGVIAARSRRSICSDLESCG